MSDKSTAELERDAEIARARVADTAESIKNKMSPGQLIDELTGLFSGGDGSAALNNLKAQIRDNPLPLTLVGTGLAWLMLGQGASNDRPDLSRGYRDRWQSQGASRFGSAGDRAQADYSGTEDDYFGTEDAESRRSMGDVLSDASDTVTSAAGSAADAVANAASGAKRRLGETAGQYSAGAGDMAQRARQTAGDLLQREPLVIAALGLAVGTAIGALLPHTDVEDERIGPYSSKVRDTAEGLLEKGMNEAKDVAAEAYQTIKEEADRQGLSGSGDKSVVEQVGNVVKSAATRTEEAIRERAGTARDPSRET